MIQCIGYDKKRKAYVYKDTETGEITYEKDTEVEESIEEPIKLSNEKIEPKQIYDPETMKTITNTEHIDKHHDDFTPDIWLTDAIASKSVFRPEDAVSATIKLDSINDMYEPTKILSTTRCIICDDPATHPICDNCKAAILELKSRLYSGRLNNVEMTCSQNVRDINDINHKISNINSDLYTIDTKIMSGFNDIEMQIQILKENNKHE